LGQWTWLLHRITGIAVVYFLCLHIFETLQLARGVDVYNEATAPYRQPWFRPFEFALVMAVVYHAANGIRVTLFDWWPRIIPHRKKISWLGIGLLGVLMPVIGYVMMKNIFALSLGEILADLHGLPYAAMIVLPVLAPVLYLFWRGAALVEDRRVILSPSGGLPSPATDRFEKWAWMFMRISGVLLLILALWHVFIMHIQHDISEVTGQSVVDRFLSNPGWIAVDLSLLVLAWLHGLNGLRIVLTDYVRRGSRRRTVLVLIGVFAAVWLFAGGYVLFLIPSLVK